MEFKFLSVIGSTDVEIFAYAGSSDALCFLAQLYSNGYFEGCAYIYPLPTLVEVGYSTYINHKCPAAVEKSNTLMK